jgi:hypothetical protein
MTKKRRPEFKGMPIRATREQAELDALITGTGVYRVESLSSTQRNPRGTSIAPQPKELPRCHPSRQ